MRPGTTLLAVPVALGLLAGCGAARPTAASSSLTPVPTTPTTAAPTTSAVPTTPTRTATPTPSKTAVPTTHSATPTPTPTRSAVPAAAPLPAFHASAAAITTAELASTYHSGCPTPAADLRELTLSYVDFSGHAQIGHLVVNAAYVGSVETVFARLYAERFPIRRMVPVSAYGGSDEKSVAADNTAGFNCRDAVTAGGAPSWSMHAYGEAIDVDPVENPYIYGGTVDPSDGAAYTDRADHRPGMAYAGGQLVDAFAAVGWKWGASFDDYQHFSTNGT